MIKYNVHLVLLLIMVLPLGALAQDDAEQAAYVYATYFICDPAGEARADEIIARNFKPHYDTAVEAGNLLSWGWLAHFVGGDWRRALILSASSMDDLLDASGALGEIIEETTPEAGRAFTEVCSTHVDYIWETVPGGASADLGEERGEAGFSTYFSCDGAREDEADQLVTETFAPIYNKYVASGELDSWIWLKHNVGGDRRRILSLTGASHKDLSRVRIKIAGDLAARRTDRARREFLSICQTHEDYMWDIQIETP